MPGRCFTADVDKYMYEICPYGDSAQKDGQSRTSLGSWKGFEENYSFMSFSGGQICWNGPQRSMRVRPLGPLTLHNTDHLGQNQKIWDTLHVQAS